MITGKNQKIKPPSLGDYNKLKAETLLANQTCSLDRDFIDKVVTGTPFYGYTQNVFGEWVSQTLIALDFDDSLEDPEGAVRHFKRLGFNPWFAYVTFSGEGNFRLVFRCDPRSTASEEEWNDFIKVFTFFGGPSVDLAARGTRRFWQGSWGLTSLLYVAKEGRDTLLRPDLFKFKQNAVRQQGVFL